MNRIVLVSFLKYLSLPRKHLLTQVSSTVSLPLLSPFLLTQNITWLDGMATGSLNSCAVGHTEVLLMKWSDLVFAWYRIYNYRAFSQWSISIWISLIICHLLILATRGISYKRSKVFLNDQREVIISCLIILCYNLMAPLKAISGCWKCQTKVDVVRGEGKIKYYWKSYWKNLLYVTIVENMAQMAADCSPLGSSFCCTESQTKCCWLGSCIRPWAPFARPMQFLL